jgi:peptide-methionine (R)-S-oxide reductase
MLDKTNDEWKKELTEEQYRVMREGGTEAPGTGKFLHEKSDGTFSCAACGQALFKSDAKFDSGTGWPSFDRAIVGAVIEKEDQSLGMRRVETQCGKCGAHLGHVFPDGPTETGNRYCINSVCLDLEKERNK